MTAYFEFLRRLGVHCEVIPIVEDYMLPSGWIRGKRVRDEDVPWLMKMSFDKSAGGTSTLKALKSYIVKLDYEYGKTAFRYFSKANMRVLLKINMK